MCMMVRMKTIMKLEDLEYKWFKRYIARNPRVLNGCSYQVFSQVTAQSEHI